MSLVNCQILIKGEPYPSILVGQRTRVKEEEGEIHLALLQQRQHRVKADLVAGLKNDLRNRSERGSVRPTATAVRRPGDAAIRVRPMHKKADSSQIMTISVKLGELLSSLQPAPKSSGLINLTPANIDCALQKGFSHHVVCTKSFGQAYLFVYIQRRFWRCHRQRRCRAPDR